MEAAGNDNHNKPPLQQHEEERRCYEKTVADDAAAAAAADSHTINKNKHLISAAADDRGWKAMPYVIGNETCQKLGTIGTTANLLVYLTTVYGMKSASAANLWGGTVNLAPVLGAFLSDSYLGRYATIALASVASFAGMIILTLTAAVPSLHPASHGGGAASTATGPQMAVLLVSFALLAVGAGGIRPCCNLAFGADQFDPRTAAGRKGIASFFNWYYFTFTIAMMVSATVIIYLQSNVSWALGLAVPATLMGLSCALFFMGSRLYVRVRPDGSPLTSFAQVLVAAYRKRRRPAAIDGELYDPPHTSSLVSKIAYTHQFRCLDKAAIIDTPEDTPTIDPWRLCSVQQVEEVKCLARILPVWSSGIVYYIVLTNLGNYNVLQAMQTDRRIGTSFQIPAGSFVVFNMLALTLWLPLYDGVVVPALRRLTGREGGITHAAAADRGRHRHVHRHHAARRGRGAPPPHRRRRHVLLRARAAADAGGAVGGLRRHRTGRLLLQAVPGEHAQRRRRAALPGVRHRQLRQRPHGHGGAPDHGRRRRPPRLAHAGPQPGQGRPLLPAHRGHGGAQPRLLRGVRQMVQVQEVGGRRRCRRDARAGGKKGGWQWRRGTSSSMNATGSSTMQLLRPTYDDDDD